MTENKNLNQAKKAKKDEFYTQLSDIENELRHYKSQFKDKVIFCNCDDPYESNFFKYFALNFNHLGIKKLIATCHSSSPVVGSQPSLFEVNEINKNNSRNAYKIEIQEVTDENGDGAIDLTDVQYLLKNKKNVLTLLEGDGDFRSEECINLLKQSDIVVTNPPFSLFREFIAQLVEYDKQFITIGNTNALTYKEIFKLIKDDKLRTGYTNFNVGMYFYVPDYIEKFHRIENGRKMVRVSTSCWFTNLEVSKHKEYMTLYRTYSPDEYNKYENFDGINIDRVSEIPMDYFGAMGVPITFLDKYNPEQFEIIGLGISTSGLEAGVQPYKPEHKKYRREIQGKGAVDGDLYMMKDNVVDVPYARVLIKRRESL